MAPPTRIRTATGPTVCPPIAREPPGTLILDRYRLRKPLGAGGFGTVWLAYDERLEREVAIKMLPSARVIGGRFEREARATARLNHPGIVTLYESAVDDSAAYLVSELVRGRTFADLLASGQLSDRDIVGIAVALVDALEHAHRQGVVHRDVKPSNVLIPEDPSSSAAVAKLTDFGVARVIGANALTRTGEVVGTAAYMAPEQAEGREADAAADLYSLALVLYEALSGVNPVDTGAAGIRARRLGAHLPPLRRHRRDLPPELGRAIDLALRPRPRERGTLRELRMALAGTLDEVEDLPPVVESPWPVPPRETATRAALSEDRQRPGFRWPGRALAAAGAAGIAGWLTATAFPSPPLTPSLAALLAGAAVALLPRIGWLALTLALTLGLVASGRPTDALIVLGGLLLPVVLLARAPSRWSAASAAPALGLVMLAGAWPALAGQDRRVWRRVALGALGWIWLALAGLLGDRAAYVEPSSGHAVWPLIRSGMLAPALVWAVAAAMLPWIVRGALPIRVVLVTVWSAVLASSTTTTLQALHVSAAPRPSTVVLGAVAGGIVALTPTLNRARPKRSTSPDSAAGLA